jgi:hypothetical protein
MNVLEKITELDKQLLQVVEKVIISAEEADQINPGLTRQLTDASKIIGDLQKRFGNVKQASSVEGSTTDELEAIFED